MLMGLMLMSPGQMLLTHFIIVIRCIGQMLLCQSVFSICWFMMIRNQHSGQEIQRYGQNHQRGHIFHLPTITGAIET